MSHSVVVSQQRLNHMSLILPTFFFGQPLSSGSGLGNLGIAVIGTFVLCWIGSLAVWQWRGYDRL
jgi:high-affinity nickel permease